MYYMCSYTSIGAYITKSATFFRPSFCFEVSQPFLINKACSVTKLEMIMLVTHLWQFACIESFTTENTFH